MAADTSPSPVSTLTSSKPQVSQPPEIDRALPYVPALDGLRAVAIACVLAVHLDLRLFQGGSLGVYLFFSLSGYLITTILLNEISAAHRVGLTRFYARRAIRLLPALVILVAVVTVYSALRPPPGLMTSPLTIPSALFYFANWVRAAGLPLGLFEHTWTLSVEEQFYLIWPVLLVALFRYGGRRAALAFALFGVAASLCARLILYHGAASSERIFSGSDTNADQILLGCALAIPLYCWRTGPARRVLTRGLEIAVWPAALLLAAAVIFEPASTAVHGAALAFELTGALTLFAVCCTVVVGYIITHPASRGARALGIEPLRWLGRISYSLYLWHFPVFLVVNGTFGVIHNQTGLHEVALKVAELAVEVLVSLILASGSYYLVERPVLRLRRRLAPSVRLSRHHLAERGDVAAG